MCNIVTNQKSLRCLMAPVVRISDDVFRRLQRLGEPLVDSPSTVIERVLDHYEAAHSIRGAPTSAGSFSPRALAAAIMERGPMAARCGNVFLVPTVRENVRATLDRAVPLQVARECLSDD